MKKRLIILVIVSLLSCLTYGCEQQKESEGDKSTKKSAAIPSGEYWATYSNLPGPPESLKELNVEGPFYINSVSIVEVSTKEELAVVNFSEDETSASDTNERDHSKYWAEIIQNEKGKPVSVKLSSNAANDFVVTIYFNMVEQDLPAYHAQLKSDDGVHSSDGSVIPNPYEDPELPIAGVKQLNFKESREEGNKIRNSLEAAGYETFSMLYGNGVYTISTVEDLVSRAKIEETVLKPKDWTTDKDKSKGNVGFYSKSGNFTGNITINWELSNIPFTIEIKDASLKKLEDGEDETNYTMSGTAEIKQKSFKMGDMLYQLTDKQKKSFSEEYGFKVVKEPNPSVMWDYVETWEYTDDKYGTLFLLTVSYTTRNSPTDMSSVPVKGLDEIGGTDTMSFMMPAYGGTATWTFKAE